MGMDYQYVGSASYPRFEREISELAKALGVREKVQLRDPQKESNVDGWVDSMFGTLYRDEEGKEGEITNKEVKGESNGKDKFIYPEEMPEVVRKWFNNPYGDFTAIETDEIWYYMHNNKDKLEEYRKNNSDQILTELGVCHEVGDSWYIS